jgi:glyoxylase-like metal-dependent hydrolase (beta-lactamase superfamily II)
MSFSRTAFLLSASLVCCLPVVAQFGPPEPQGSGPKLKPPTAFPAPGTFPTTESVTLLSEPGAVIHYTFDGSTPTSRSPVYDPLQVLFIGGIYEGEKGLKAGYTIRAVAIKPGNTNSDIANFQYTVDRRDRTAYASEQILPGVRMIRDSDNDKMFLLKGQKKYLLIDSGQGTGELKKYLEQYTGGLPIEPVFTHNHGDHIGQADQFIRDSVEHIGEADRPGAEHLLRSRGIPDDVISSHLLAIHEGDHIDLGDRSVVIHETPGHTPGSLVVFDPKNGYLFTGDSYGSNSPTIPDALWMQFTKTPVDAYLAVIVDSREKFRGQVKYLMTGHNDHPLIGEKYLDNLQAAVQQLMDQGDKVLVPSYRPAGLLQVVVGDRLTDPNWVAINVNKDHYLPAPVDQIAGVVGLQIAGGTVHPAFSPEIHEYSVALPAESTSAKVTVTPTSSRSSELTWNGTDVLGKKGVDVKVSPGPATISVTAPDGKTQTTYILNLR